MSTALSSYLCEACDTMRAQERDARCAKHGGPSVDELREKRGRIGDIGPVPFLLAGGDPAREPRA